MSILSTVASGTNKLVAGSSALSLVGSTAALLRGDQGVRGINNFLFHIPTGEEITMSAQITDHYVEGNYAVQDHIALEPLRIRLSGQIAELVYTKSQVESYIDTVLDRLGVVNALNPAGSAAAKQYLAQYNRTSQAIGNAWDTVRKSTATLVGLPTQNKQQEAFEQIYEWFNARSTVLNKERNGYALLTVETPWATLNNMAIETATFSQDEDTRDWSNIEITLKQIRFVTAKVVTEQLQGRAKSGGAVENKGTAQPVPYDQSTASAFAAGKVK